MKVIEERKPGFVYITETLEILIQSSSIASARILQKTLDEVKNSWDLVSSLAENQTLKLQASLDRSTKLDDLNKEFEIWLFGVEETCAAFDTPATLLETVEEQLANLKVIVNHNSSLTEFSTVFDIISWFGVSFHLLSCVSLSSVAFCYFHESF